MGGLRLGADSLEGAASHPSMFTRGNRESGGFSLLLSTFAWQILAIISSIPR
jgi:hypothetical protein